MVFSSVIFLCIFLPAVLLGYNILPKKARNIFLLVASLCFYACGGPKHLIYLISSVIVNFIFGIVIAKLSAKPSGTSGEVCHPRAQKIALFAAMVLNIGSLLYFKYSGMLIETWNGIFKKNTPIPDIILPLGISFYTFQCMSYLIDVYRRENTLLPDGSTESFATHSFTEFALYITMFPQLLQGPIIRFGDVREALRRPVITVDSFTEGIERFIIGLAKKVVIANTLGEVCDRIFLIAPDDLSVPLAWLGAVLYTLQIFFDFAGYTDMAIGLGKMFGFSFAENFNYPYISRSVTEFWRRWHISLSSWFRDYLYIPLGGNRRGNVYLNLLIVFLATGIWHGAAWGFLVWGLWHGVFMLIERFMRGRKAPFDIPAALASFLKWSYTILAVTLGWVLFKIEDLPEALSYIKVMFGLGSGGYTAFSVGFFLNARLVFFLVIAVIACVPWAQVLPVKPASFIAQFSNSDRPSFRTARYICLILLLVVSFIFIVNSTYSPFIYFRF
ncbi:MAG: MBOAT family protein [Lachnospiraceae bacterium]|nr:MBOAT family protein [Lachnospiraceae bacterium]